MAAPRRLLASISPAAVGLAAAAGAGVVAFNMSKPYSSHAEPQKSLGQKPVFPTFGFMNLTLAEARMVNHDTRELKFKLPEDEATSGLSPVSSLLTRHTAAGSWFPTLRPYTPISTPDSPYITLLVKQYPNGRASTHLHKLEPGQTLSVKSIPELSYKQNQYKHLVLVAGGAGITPMFQALRSVLDNPEDKTRTEFDILLKTELDDLASRYPQRFTTRYVVNDSRVTDKSLEKGYVTKDILSKALPAEIDGDDIKILVCGPPAMMDAVAGAKGGMGWAQGKLGGMLKDLGFTEKQVHKF
ncbi:cytochrome-b5 reductase [Aureobasidium subglaciale]|nr:cytochrome-b5 reductase [Aureobasidium subglaciale]